MKLLHPGQSRWLHGQSRGLLYSVCGFRVDWKPVLTYATFGCKTSACCFYPGSTLQLVCQSTKLPLCWYVFSGGTKRRGGEGGESVVIQQASNSHPRNIIAQTRTGSHWLHTETGHHKKLAKQDGTCPMFSFKITNPGLQSAGMPLI